MKVVLFYDTSDCNLLTGCGDEEVWDGVVWRERLRECLRCDHRGERGKGGMFL